MKDRFYIVDTKNKTFYRGETDSIPWIINGFTDNFVYAKEYATEAAAKAACKRFENEKFEFDGNTPLAKGRLAVVKMTFTAV